MSLKKVGKFWYGTTPEDTQAEVRRYSALNGYVAAKFSASTCTCSNKTFKLETDENEGVARRTCTSCGRSHLLGDSASYVHDADLKGHGCICEGTEFELMSGVALYDGSGDVSWYYIGCQCARCHLTGVFADWKCEAGDADSFLASA